MHARTYVYSMAATRQSPAIPLLTLSEPTENGSHRNEDETARDSRRMLPCPSKWNWRNMFTLLTVGLAFVFVNVAFSNIGPFFPIKVLAIPSTRMLQQGTTFHCVIMNCRLLRKAQRLHLLGRLSAVHHSLCFYFLLFLATM